MYLYEKGYKKIAIIHIIMSLNEEKPIWEQFKTKKQLKEICDKIIYEIGICKSVKNTFPHYIKFFDFLFNRHTDYPNKFLDYEDVTIYKNTRCSKWLEVAIVKKDKSFDSVSIINCVSMKPQNNLCVAMRDSIVSQILSFKNSLYKNGDIKCSICNSTNEIQIDHIKQFVDIQVEFIDKYKTDYPNMLFPSKFITEKINHQVLFREEDNHFKCRWIEYHLNNATLQPLCKNCNLTRPKSKNKFPKNLNF